MKKSAGTELERPSLKNGGMYDIHSHILPGLDDGAPNWEKSLAMAGMAVDDGIAGMVCTPHWVSGFFNNDKSAVLRVFKTFQEKLDEHRIPLSVYPGSELRLDFEIPERISSGELLTINDTGRYALIEFPEEVIPQNLDHFFWELQMQDVIPVIVHPERNRVIQRDPARLYRLVELGALTQITGASLTGRFGNEIRKFSIMLLEHHLAHVLATDAHSPDSRAPKLAEASREAERILGAEMADRMVRDNPRRIIDGLQVTPFDLIPLGKRDSLWKKVFFMFGRKSR